MYVWVDRGERRRKGPHLIFMPKSCLTGSLSEPVQLSECRHDPLGLQYGESIRENMREGRKGGGEERREKERMKKSAPHRHSHTE